MSQQSEGSVQSPDIQCDDSREAGTEKWGQENFAISNEP